MMRTARTMGWFGLGLIMVGPLLASDQARLDHRGGYEVPAPRSLTAGSPAGTLTLDEEIRRELVPEGVPEGARQYQSLQRSLGTGQPGFHLGLERDPLFNDFLYLEFVRPDEESGTAELERD